MGWTGRAGDRPQTECMWPRGGGGQGDEGEVAGPGSTRGSLLDLRGVCGLGRERGQGSEGSEGTGLRVGSEVRPTEDEARD